MPNPPIQKRPPCPGAIAAFLSLLLAFPVLGAPLVVDSVYPAGGQRGSTATVTVSGKFDKTPLQIWADTPALKFEPGKAPNTFTVKIPADAPLGPHLLRVYTADEVSTVRCFVVGDQIETAEAEPNDEIASAQAIKQLPALINAQLDKSGDFDCYAVELKAGETLVASIQGRRLGSAIDPMLHLLDPEGNELAYAQDGLGLDPLLVFKVSKTGKYIVRVSAFFYPPAADVRLAGGKDAVYRLSLTTGPFMRAASPLGVPRGKKTAIQLLGYNIANPAFEVDATNVPAFEDNLFIPIPAGESRLRIDLDDTPAYHKSATTKPADVSSAPFNVDGLIAAPGAEDRYTFSAKKGDRLTFSVRAESAYSPLDAVLIVKDSSGKTLLTQDDPSGPSHDPRQDWDAPKDDVYTASLTDRFGKGGTDYFYRLSVQRRVPQTTADPDADAYLLAPGKTSSIKLKIARREGDITPLAALALNLPPGVTATSAPLPPTSGEITLMLSAASDAKAVSTPIKLMLLGTDPARPEARVISYDLRKDKDKPGIPELIDSTSDIWLTVSVQPAKPVPAK